MPRPCEHIHPLTPDGCKFCWRAVNDPKWQKVWGLPVTAGVRSKRRGASRIVPVNVHRAPAKRKGGRLPLEMRPPCKWEGRVVETCSSCSITSPQAELRHRRLCHNDLVETDAVTRGVVDRKWQACIECPHYRQPIVWISTKQYADDVINVLLAKLPPDLSGIVGIPRSGMIGAAILACHLHLPLFTIEGGSIKPCGHGWRGFQQRPGPMLVLDDTLFSGAAMRGAKKALGVGRFQQQSNYLFASVYTRWEAAHHCDIYGRIVSAAHWCEWNIFNNLPGAGSFCEEVRGGVASDFDGIICRDGAPDQPLHLPRRWPLPAIITGRGEQVRRGTEAWMQRWGVKTDRLIMRPPHVPNTWQAIAAFKAEELKKLPATLYIESDPQQAEAIWRQSGKTVICPAIDKVFQDGAP